MPEELPREIELLNAALELPAVERSAFLDEACANDLALRQNLEELIAAQERGGKSVEVPSAAMASRRTKFVTFPVTEKAGDEIGHYKLLQQIGEGGCGVVYMAEQEEPVRRRVALKVIKLGMDTKQVIARFEAERQALALMDHPNIAKVFDAGATDTGRTYFVMELIRGVKITEFCDDNKLSTEERLQLFIQVCQAIQHAHQKGVIHRDIKPSNILVSVNDGIPVPKVIDFGIAKATAGRLTDQTLFTAFDQFIGTPAYMSPEQAVMTTLDIDTRSDVYSLGVLLYELLIGKPPFDPRDLMKAGFDEMRRIIREEDPPRPSTRLSAMLGDELTTTAKHRRTEPPKLVHVLRGDLDWIVMKCLEKERGRRYETANGLAADIQRYVDNEPIEARPPSRLYEFQKTVQRHKFGFTAATALLLVLAMGIVASSWQAIRATRAERQQSLLRQEADAEKKRAQTEAARAEQVAQFMRTMLRAAGPSVARGRDAALLREILENTAGRVTKELSGQPEVSGDLWMTIGHTYFDIGDKDQAIRMFEQAAANYERTVTNHPAKLARALGSLGRAQSFQQRVSEGKANAWRGVEIARQLTNETLLADSLVLYAESFEAWGVGSTSAIPYIREAITIYRKQGTNHTGLANALSTLADSLNDNTAEAEAAIREARALDAKSPNTKDSTAEAGNAFVLGQRLLDNDKPAEAEAELRRALDLWRKLYNPKHPYRGIVFRIFIQSLAVQKKWQQAKAEIVREAQIFPGNDYCATLETAWAFHTPGWPKTSPDEIMPSEKEIKTNSISFNTAIVLARTGRLAEYRLCAQELLNRASQQRDHGRAEQAAKVALLFPSEATNTLAAELADFAATATAPDGFVPWVTMTKALAEYRRGRAAEAIHWANESIESPKADPACQATACFIRALAQKVAQEDESARSSLALGQQLCARFKKRVILEHWKFSEYWTVRDWIIAEFLRLEAEAAIAAQEQ